MASEVDPDRTALQDEQQRFWGEFLADLKLDDPEQQVPKPSRQGYVAFMLPAPGGSSWLTVYRDLRRGEVGVFLASSRNSAGEFAMLAIADDWAAVKTELGGTVELRERDKRPHIIDAKVVGPLGQADVRKRGFAWLAERVNTFVNVMRPRVRSAVADYRAEGS
jgi:hypothetical protein